VLKSFVPIPSAVQSLTTMAKLVYSIKRLKR
jgi:hypothetical protein